MNLNQIELSYTEYTQAFEAGVISKEEYKNLLEGLEIEQAITMSAEELQRKEQLNIVINAAIMIASAAV
jgi:hypothetical protein